MSSPKKELPQYATTSIPKQKLPQCSETLQDTRELEERPYVLSFSKYKRKLCELEHLERSQLREALQTLKKIGTKVFCTSDFTSKEMKPKKIDRRGEYLKLYNKLAEDITIFEIKIGKRERIFYFEIESQRTFYVVAITANHLETDKVRR